MPKEIKVDKDRFAKAGLGYVERVVGNQTFARFDHPEYTNLIIAEVVAGSVVLVPERDVTHRKAVTAIEKVPAKP